MVAYSFKAIFAPQIALGTKRQTIRADRRRHARPGEAIQLYTGMRTKHCAKIRPDVTCTAIAPVTIQISTLIDALITGISVDGAFLTADEIEAFATADGFDPRHYRAFPHVSRSAREHMGRFWLENHGEGWFDGVLIRWSLS